MCDAARRGMEFFARPCAARDGSDLAVSRAAHALFPGTIPDIRDLIAVDDVMTEM